jgi:hypothetical protein
MFLIPLVASCDSGSQRDADDASRPVRARFATQVSVEDLSYCLTKDWGRRLSLSPASGREGVAALVNPVLGIAVDVLSEPNGRLIIVRSRRDLTAAQLAAVRDCTEGLDKAFSAAD